MLSATVRRDDGVVCIAPSFFTNFNHLISPKRDREKVQGVFKSLLHSQKKTRGTVSSQYAQDSCYVLIFFTYAVYLKAIQVNSTFFCRTVFHFFFLGGGGGVVAHWQMIVKFKHNFVYVRWVGKTSHREGNKKIKNAEHPPHDQTVFLLTFSTLCKMQKPLSCYRSHKNRTEGQMNS